MIWLIQYVVMTAKRWISREDRVPPSKSDLRSVEKTDDLTTRKARRELMSVDLCASTAIKVDDFQRDTGRLEQDVSQGLHSRMIDLDLVRVDVGVAVAGNSVRKHEGSIVVRASFHPC